MTHADATREFLQPSLTAPLTTANLLPRNGSNFIANQQRRSHAYTPPHTPFVSTGNVDEASGVSKTNAWLRVI